MKRGVLIAAALWAAAASQAAAQGVGASIDVETIAMKQAGDVRYWWVKFVCGTIEPDPASPQNPASPNDPLVPGTYRTAINITTATSLLGLKVAAAEARPLGEPTGPTGQRDLGVLIEGTAVEVDCEQIIDILYLRREGGGTAPPFVKGFVRIYHPGGAPLGPGSEGGRAKGVHVVAVYTSNRVAGP